MKKILNAILSYLLFWVMYFLGLYAFKIRNRVKVVGKENLPHSEGVFYVSNHETFLDSLLIGMGIINIYELFFKQRRLPWNAPDYGNFFKKRKSRRLVKLLKCIPVERGNTNISYIKELVATFCDILKRNNLLLFFQGTRTRNGIVGECKYGPAKTILDGNPKFIIPIFLSDIQQIMPIEIGQNYKKISKGKKGTMIIGKPVSFSDIISSEKTEKEKIELIKDRIRTSVLNLDPKMNS